MTERHVYRIFLPFLVAVLACNLATPNAGVPTAAPAAGQSSATPAPAATVAPFLEASPTPEPLPPLVGFEENLFARIDAGEWTLETGLVTTLKLFVGEAEVAEVNPGGQEILSNEVVGIASLASDYVENGQDPATKTELQRLLDMIFPDPEKIRELAQPIQGSASARTVNVNYVQTNCVTLWRAGWPAGTGALCYEYRHANFNGRDYEVFFPIEWGTEDVRRQFAELTLDAVRDAVATYTPYGEVPPANIVFTLSQDYTSDRSASLAMATLFSNPCRVAVFPAGADALMANGEEVFKQLIAHEMFHCFQNQNLVYHPGTYSSNAWWVEGTASHFSNVVYPAVNAEHAFARTFDINSVNRSLFEMNYENFLFFQHFSNVASNGAIISLIQDMPRLGDVSAQRAYLAAYPGMGELFHEFARAYLNGEILDANGPPVPVGPVLDETERFESSPGSYEHPIEARSFVIRRVVLNFPERTRHTLREEGGEALTSASRLLAPGPWSLLPARIAAGCQDRQLVYLLTDTSADDSTVTKTIHTAVTRLPDTMGCDECLVGQWLMDNNSMWTAFVTIISSAGSQFTPTLESMSGRVVLTFFEEGLADLRYEALQIQYSQTVPMPRDQVMRTDATTLNNGNFVTDWFTDGEGKIYATEIYALPDMSGTAVITAGGISQTIEMDPPVISLLGDGEYVCSENALALSGYPGQFIDYTRISR